MKNFHDILEEKASKSDLNKFYKNLEEDPDKKEEILDFANIWHLSSGQNKHLKMSRKKQLFNNFWKRTQPQIQSYRWYHSVFKYAAVVGVSLVVGTAISSLLQQDKSIQYTCKTDAGMISSLELEDGKSSITLNANSKVELSVADDKTIVELNGEAYFDVFHNKKRQFIVDCGAIKVVDIGTKFNIKSYPEDSTICTTLLDGAIDIYDVNGKVLRQIKPGEAIVYNKIKQTHSAYKCSTINSTAWKEKRLVFENQSLREVCTQLVQWYKVEIVFDDNFPDTEKITCVLRCEDNVADLLDVLRLTVKFNYKIKEDAQKGTIIYIK